MDSLASARRIHAPSGLLLVVATMILGFASPAMADTYRYLARDEDNNAVFLDDGSIVRDERFGSAWVIVISAPYLANRPAKYAYYLLKQDIDCVRQTLRPAGMSVYDAAGRRLEEDTKGGKAGSIEPGGMERSIFDVVCRGDLSHAPSVVNQGSPIEMVRQFKKSVQAASPK